MRLSRLAPLALATVLPGCHSSSDNVVLAASVVSIIYNIHYFCGQIIGSGQRIGDKTDGQCLFTADYREYASRADVCDCKVDNDVSGCNIVLGTGGGAKDTDPSIGFAEIRPSQDGFRIDAKQPYLPPFPPPDSPNFADYDAYTYSGPFAMVRQGDECKIEPIAGRNAPLSDNARDADDIAMNCDALREELQKSLGELMQQAQARP